jgi:hypothetical protein
MPLFSVPLPLSFEGEGEEGGEVEIPHFPLEGIFSRIKANCG